MRTLEETGRPVGRLAVLLRCTPHREAHGAGPERGTDRKGQEPLVTWGFSK
jgi:hypothetical protein